MYIYVHIYIYIILVYRNYLMYNIYMQYYNTIFSYIYSFPENSISCTFILSRTV